MKLAVYLGENLAGHLTSTADKGVVFSYDSIYLNAGHPPISLSLPLGANEFTQRECLPFFEGLLPEGDVKRRISDYLHISETSTLKLLQELGGECAGLVSILPDGEENKTKNVYEFSSQNYDSLSEKKLAEYITNINTRPLLKAKEKLRLSLAGAQEKLPLTYVDGKYYLPKNGAPSTHIVKPTGSGELSSLAANEYICTKLAEYCGLPTSKMELKRIGDVEFLLINRYDRIRDENCFSRIHQEDMCQALGILSDRKYQNDGGPGIADIYKLIKEKTTIPLLETRNFLRYVVFNLIIGNCDAHGKNYSLLFRDGTIRLAPIYDAVCTIVYPNLTRKFSMKVGKHYEIKKVNLDDFGLLAEEMGLKSKTILDCYSDIAENVADAFERLKEDLSLKEHGQTLEAVEKSVLKNLKFPL
ncbi:type II toxin-antitoxin system HipA family toxin [Fibrobacter sp. UWB13]|uniref:type II toxin-antitoxin system HipA family toxin n=1 Tax=Fibrobacter sp. UWB13 TaxID=1896204 RepID=UPI000A0D7C78|nr:type II toxin-antitoxin system HipA family toxin [Fibrobacter sp. UWB13]SMG22710.1 serine/threonine-protein kinase HipA [Fibrobacter sp. UWB13]